MVKINNTFKACALFAGVLYLLYGGKLVNEWRGSRRGGGGSYWPDERPATRTPFAGGQGNPVDILWDNPTPPSQKFMQGTGGGGSY